jgi:hypothetical protein
VAVDYLARVEQFGTSPFFWYVGPGVYFSMGFGRGEIEFSTYGIGLRGNTGIVYPFARNLELFGAFVPALGLGIIGDSFGLIWHAGSEIGIRYRF